MINQDSTDKHLSYDRLLHYTFIIHFSDKRIVNIGEHLAKLQAKWLIVSLSYAGMLKMRDMNLRDMKMQETREYGTPSVAYVCPLPIRNA